MSSEEKEEQITIEPERKVERVKDPRKVAAGKSLVEYHKKAKKALKDSEEKSTEESWIPEISFSTAIGLVGIGLTAVDIYFRYKKTSNEEKKYKPKLEPIKEEKEETQTSTN